MSTKTGTSITPQSSPGFRPRENEIRAFVEGVFSQYGVEKTTSVAKMIPQFIEQQDKLERDILVKAGGGAKSLAYLIGRFLEDYHQGLITMPSIDATKQTPVPGNRLVYDFISAVAHNDKALLRKIAETVPIVHERASGRRDGFHLTPADRARASVLAHVEKHGPPQNLAETRRLMIEAGFQDKNLDDREVGRWHKQFGGAPGKPGRKPKVKVASTVKRTVPVSLKEIRARAAAVSARLPTLLPEPTIKTGQKSAKRRPN